MRIAIVTSTASVVGGIESYLDAVIPLLEADGHEIALLCEYDAPPTARPISRSSSAPLWSMADIGEEHALDSLRRWRPDVIYTHGLFNLESEARALAVAPAVAYAHDYRATCISGSKAFAFPATMPCARRFGLGCVANFYPRRCGGLNPLTMLTDFRRAARRFDLLRSLRAVLTASEFVRAEYLRNGLAPEAIRCVGLPVIDRGVVRPAIPETPTVALSTATLRLLFAGRTESFKGGLGLLDALPLVSSALSRPLVLTFAGDGSARLQWTRHADAIMRCHPTLRVDFAGWVEPIALTAMFDSSDLLVVPSLWPEPFGLVGPEAGMRGLPAAGFAVGGIPEWLTDGANGALAYGHPPAAADLANAIVRCLRDPIDHARLRSGAMELARRFSPERHLQALVDVFYRVSMQSSAVSVAVDSGSTMSRAS